MSNLPLHYNISNWLQLAECKSNNSTDLYITVKQIIDDGSHRLQGTNILVNHSQYGTLFACLVNSNGSLLTPDPESGIIKEFSTDEILVELNKFGFDVTFHINQHLSGEQISYLITLAGLSYDKIRRLPVYEYDNQANKIFSDYLVVFNSDPCPNWVEPDFACNKTEFLQKLNDGVAINLTNMSQTKLFDWTWLTSVEDIDDIIEENGYGDEEEEIIDG